MTTVPRNLDALSFKQISALETKIDRAMDARYEEVQAKLAKKHAEFHSRLLKLATDMGLQPDEVRVLQPKGAVSPRKSRKGTKIAPKYRDPQRPQNTWTGRGRQPRWLAALVKEGRKPQEFLIGAPA